MPATRRSQRSEVRGQKSEVHEVEIGQAHITVTSVLLFYLLSLLLFALGLMSKPMLVTWPFVMLLLDYWPLKSTDSKHSTRTMYSTCTSTLLLLRREDPLLPPRSFGERRDVPGAAARRRYEAGRTPGLGHAQCQCADFVWPLSGEAVLARGSGGFLSASRTLAAGQVFWRLESILGISVLVWVWRRRASVFADRVPVVFGHAGPGDWAGASRRTGDGGSLYLFSIAGSAGPRSLGRIRIDRAPTVSGAGVVSRGWRGQSSSASP